MNAELKWLTDPEVFRVNVLPAHSDHICYTSEAESGITSLRQSLDGQWAFKWSKTPESRPTDFWRNGCDISDFGTITVPAHIKFSTSTLSTLGTVTRSFVRRRSIPTMPPSVAMSASLTLTRACAESASA